MQKLCCVRTRQHPLPVWSHNLSSAYQTISQPILNHFWWELYHRATIKRNVIETSKLLDDQHDNAIDEINFHLDVGQGRAETIMSYVQILDHLDQQEQQEDLYKFRAITGHQGPSHLKMRITKAANIMSW